MEMIMPRYDLGKQNALNIFIHRLCHQIFPFGPLSSSFSARKCQFNANQRKSSVIRKPTYIAIASRALFRKKKYSPISMVGIKRKSMNTWYAVKCGIPMRRVRDVAHLLFFPITFPYHLSFGNPAPHPSSFSMKISRIAIGSARTIVFTTQMRILGSIFCFSYEYGYSELYQSPYDGEFVAESFELV